MTNTQPSCSGRGESDHIPNTFKKAMGLPQAVRWKAASDEEITSLEKHGVFKMVSITSVPAGHKGISTRWVFKIKANSTYNGRLVVLGFSQILRVDTPAIRPELSLNQPEEKLLNEEGKRRFQVITGGVIYLAHVTRYDILYAINQLARSIPKPVKAHIGVAKRLLRYLTRFADFFFTYKQGSFMLAAFRMLTGAIIPTTTGLRHHTS